MIKDSTSKKYKVVLYNPQSVFYTMPLGLLAVGSSLDQDACEVRIIDGRLAADSVGRVVDETEHAVCLGVSVITGAPIRDALRISRAVKAERPDLPIIWGGWHASLFPVETLQEPSVDIAVQGQGEKTFSAILETLVGGGTFDGLKGIAYRTGDGVRFNPAGDLKDMNCLAAYDYELIPVERYFVLKGRKQMDYISSTGCHYRCGFCADSLVYRRRRVALNPTRIGEEISGLWQRYRFEDLSFQDETFFTSGERITEIAENFLRSCSRFTWSAAMRADQGSRIPEEVFELCALSGLRQAIIGVESGSQEMLDWMHKDITVEQVLDCAGKCRRHDIGAIFPFIVGFPGESEESVWATIDLAKMLRRMSPRFETPFFYYKPYPGALIQENRIPGGYRMPETLDAWSEFDFIGTSGPWVASEKYRLIENFKFYNHLAGFGKRPVKYLLPGMIARWRCKHDLYHLPLERVLVEWLKPPPKLS